MASFELEILASDKTFFKGQAEEIIIPSIDGQIGIMANHSPMIIAVSIGEMRAKIDGEWKKAVVSSGMAQIINNKVTILIDTVERPEEIDVKRAEESKIRAEERLRQKQSIMQYHQSRAALTRAMSRLSASRKDDRI